MTHEEIIEEVRLARDEANAVANRLVALLGKLETEEIQPVVKRALSAWGNPQGTALAIVGARPDPSVYEPSSPMDVVPSDEEIFAEQYAGRPDRTWRDREGALEEIRTARNYLIYESVYRVELNHPVLLHPTGRKTRVHYVETSDENSATEDFRTRPMSRKGIVVIDVWRANEGDLVEYLEEA